jgi:2-(1,2-epoxy-1,2-dihydrophenyl)acetyl-CoA isomerase
MRYEPVEGLDVRLDTGVLRLSLDRPEKHNAIDDAVMAGLIDAVDAAGRARHPARGPR